MNKEITLPPIDLETVVKFLLGEGPLNEHHFGEKPDGHGTYWWRTYLREAIEADRAQRVPEPCRPDILEKLSYHVRERDDLTMDQCLSYLAEGWRKVRGRTERQLMLQLTAVLAASPPPGEPAPEPQGVPEPAVTDAINWIDDFIARCNGDDRGACSAVNIVRAALANPHPQPPAEPAPSEQEQYTYASKQATKCAECGEHKHTPLRIDAMGGYVCLTCIDQKLGTLLGEFGYPEPAPSVQPEQACGIPQDSAWQPAALPAPTGEV